MRPSGLPAGSGLPVGDLLDTSTVTVDLPVPAAVLAIGAHPDDIEFGAGATLAKWAAAGCRVHHLVLTDGSKGSWDPDEDLVELVAARQQECRAAAACIDGTPGVPPSAGRVQFLGRVDGELDNDDATRRELARVIRAVRPDVLLGHDPWRRYRLHPDHRAAGYLTLDALVAARDPHFFGDLGLEPHRPDALLLWEPDLPNHVERADGFAASKVDALLCHHSQLETTMGLGEEPGPELAGAGDDSDDRVVGHPGRTAFAGRIGWQLAQHGSLCGLDAGEAFHLMVGL
jgi:LmbE family N-acetylglucosaminyl deacetylase